MLLPSTKYKPNQKVSMMELEVEKQLFLSLPT